METRRIGAGWGRLFWPFSVASYLEDQYELIDESLAFLDNVYFYINSSPFGADPQYHYNNIDLLPIHIIEQTVKTINEREKKSANENSISTAHLCLLVAQFAGCKSKDLSIDKFLPYPSETVERLSIQTARAFVKLLEADLLPSHVITACSKYLPDIERQMKWL